MLAINVDDSVICSFARAECHRISAAGEQKKSLNGNRSTFHREANQYVLNEAEVIVVNFFSSDDVPMLHFPVLFYNFFF